MKTQDLKIAKQKMKDYRDFYGGELSRKDLIEDAKSIFDLEDVFIRHYDYISDMARDAESNLDKFKRDLEIF